METRGAVRVSVGNPSGGLAGGMDETRTTGPRLSYSDRQGDEVKAMGDVQVYGRPHGNGGCKGN